MRNLAHVEKIEKLSPIVGADRIEVAQVLGWSCVVKKGDFKEGDLCIYIEIDSIVPPWEEFEFLKDRKYKVKTIKLRGQISQGLALPINSVLLEKIGEPKIGKDVTEQLEITKFDPEDERLKTMKPYESNTLPKNKVFSFFMGFRVFRWFYYKFFYKQREKGFPNWIAKTDETRIQNNPSYYLTPQKDSTYYISEKLDGQSVTIYYKKSEPKGDRFVVCSRNVRLNPEGPGNWQKVAKKYELEKKLSSKEVLQKFKNGLAIQGEILAPDVQGNKYRVSEPLLYLFNAFDIEKGCYLSLDGLKEVSKMLDIPTVPILDEDFKLENYDLEKILKFAEGTSVLEGREDVVREGIVVRTYNQKISFKVINNQFLLNERD